MFSEVVYFPYNIALENSRMRGGDLAESTNVNVRLRTLLN